jgi:hypothetical protein
MRAMKFFILLAVIPFCSYGQKKPFFQHADIGLLAFAEAADFTKEDWPKVFENQNRIPPYNLANFEPQIYRTYNFNIKGGVGIVGRVSKSLIDHWSGNFHQVLEWRTGLQYRSFNSTSQGFHHYEPLLDTTKVYTEESVVFKSKRNIIDWTNGLIYKISGSRSGWYFFYIGGEVSLGTDLRSSIVEKYYTWRYNWQSGAYRWNQTPVISSGENYPAKKYKTLGLSIPFGLEVKMNEKFRLLLEMAYVSEHQSPRFAHRSYTDGILFNLAMRFNFK